MTSKELQNELYNVDCDFEKIDSNVSILIEGLRYRTREVERATKELKVDRLICTVMTNVKHDLEDTVYMLEDFLSTFRERRSMAEENTRLCNRLAKGGIENNESK